jgi:hypothetical protein
MGNGSLSIIVGESDGICARVMELDVSVTLGEDIDGRRGALFFGEEVFKVGKVV